MPWGLKEESCRTLCPVGFRFCLKVINEDMCLSTVCLPVIHLAILPSLSFIIYICHLSLCVCAACSILEEEKLLAEAQHHPHPPSPPFYEENLNLAIPGHLEHF